MFGENLYQLRKFHSMTQEDIADALGVSRQAVAKWECGDTVPDLDKCKILADLFGVSLDELANFDSKSAGIAPPPRGKHMFGLVTVGDKGQIVIPAKARKIFDISPGDTLLILGDEGQGLAMVKPDALLAIADMLRGKK
ncbi:MAG: helix-turn-helix domain-containing protein [Oscillospiraceae bacterium]|nr:helix-turn-helix domain-containing protein [Oscillospiraceae bacterium]